MMSIHKKSLEHISKTLKDFDTYPTYSALNDIMDKEGVDNAIKHKVLNVFQEVIRNQKQKIDEAKSWTDSLLSDL